MRPLPYALVHGFFAFLIIMGLSVSWAKQYETCQGEGVYKVCQLVFESPYGLAPPLWSALEVGVLLALIPAVLWFLFVLRYERKPETA